MHRLFCKAAVAILGFAISLDALSAFDPIPQTINYQGYLTNPGGTPLSTTVAMTFKLYSTVTGGAPLYAEVQPAVLVSNGSFNALIGAVTPIPLPFDRPYWLGVSINADAEMTPRQPLSSTPYAFRAIAVDPESASLNENFMRRGGNAFAGTAVFGTADNQVLEFRVNNGTAMRFAPSATTANIIGGSPTNSVTFGVIGATIGGGGNAPTSAPNRVTDHWGTVAGGIDNRAGNDGGSPSDAPSATGGGGDGSSFDFYSTVANEFSARATGGVRFVTAIDANGDPSRSLRILPNGELDFGSTTRQMLRLWGNESYGIGVQTDTLYLRSNNDFAWYVGGTHNDGPLTPGGTGFALMTLTNGSPAGLPAVSGIARAQTFTSTSDRAAKEAFELVDGTKVLAALVKMPLQSWKYRNEDKFRHIGPTAQDFRAAFGVGYDDKTIATVDADGVAMAAIQGLHQLVKDKEATIVGQAARISRLEFELQRIKVALGLK
ncbi:MAG: tail fiber domain-containing protein [Usitatibacteraceae bacterium]